MPLNSVPSAFKRWWRAMFAAEGAGVSPIPLTYLDTDGTLAANSDARVPSQKAVNTKVAAAIANLVNSAPGILDTLGEIAAALQADETAAGALTTTVNGKASKASNLSDLASPHTAFDNLLVHGADIASAGTLNLDTATGDLVDVTGTTSITAVTLTEGRVRTVRFTGILTLTNGASLVLPGGANITTAAGDFAILRGYAAGVVRCIGYTKASGAAVVSSGGGIGFVLTGYPNINVPFGIPNKYVGFNDSGSGATTVNAADNDNANAIIPVACTAKAITVRVTGPIASDGSLTATLRINGVDTALVLTMAASSIAGTYTVSGGSVAVAAGDLVTLHLHTNSGTTANPSSGSISHAAIYFG